MTCGERLIRCLTGDPVDRVPFGVGLGWQPWGGALAGKDLATEFGYDRSFAYPGIEYGPFPAFEEVILEKTPEHTVLRDRRGIVMRQRHDYGSMPEWIEHPVKTPDDWQRFKCERLRMDAARISTDWDRFRKKLKATGEAVQVGAFPWGVFGTPRDLLGAEELLMAFYDHPDMIHDMMQHLTGLWLALWERVAAEVQIDHIHIWEDMSGRQGSLISPAMVEEFMMPCYDRIAAFARQHGVRVVSVDTDGDCRELVPVMMRHGINMFFPFEAQAGNDILEYRRQYPTLGIMFGLDKRCLAGTLADVDREVERAAAMVKLGRYVPGFDHLIPPDAKWENFCHAAQQLKQVCYRR